MLNIGAFQIIDIENKFEQALKSGLRMLNDVLVPDDMDWDLGIGPELVEVIPNCYVLLDEFRPQARKLEVILVVYRPIVRASANHVEKGRD